MVNVLRVILTTFSYLVRITVSFDKLYNTDFIIQWFIFDVHFSLAFQFTCFNHVVINLCRLLHYKVRDEVGIDIISTASNTIVIILN